MNLMVISPMSQRTGLCQQSTERNECCMIWSHVQLSNPVTAMEFWPFPSVPVSPHFLSLSESPEKQK